MKNIFNLVAIILTMFLFGCNAEPAPTPAPAPKVNSSEPTCSNSMDKEQFLVSVQIIHFWRYYNENRR